MRSAECGMSGRASLRDRPSLAIPHSAFRTPHSGWGCGGEVFRDHRHPDHRSGDRWAPRARGGEACRDPSRPRYGDAPLSPAARRSVVDRSGRAARGGRAGERVEVAVQDERSRGIEAASSKGKRAGGGGTVRAPMPGLVVRIEVAEGQRVDAGAGLVVVEAMKMENELRAPRPGMVKTVHVAVGQAVEKGASLVTLASPEPSG